MYLIKSEVVRHIKNSSLYIRLFLQLPTSIVPCLLPSSVFVSPLSLKCLPRGATGPRGSPLAAVRQLLFCRRRERRAVNVKKQARVTPGNYVVVLIYSDKRLKLNQWEETFREVCKGSNAIRISDFLLLFTKNASFTDNISGFVFQ